MKPKTRSAGQTGLGDRGSIMERRKDVTGRISETTRFIGFGLLAVFYAVISGSEALFVDMRDGSPLLLRLIALAGVLAVLLDYLQYLFGYATTDRALDRKDAPNTYHSGWLTYRLEHFCFWAKQGFALAGCLFLISLMARSF